MHVTTTEEVPGTATAGVTQVIMLDGITATSEQAVPFESTVQPVAKLEPFMEITLPPVM